MLRPAPKASATLWLIGILCCCAASAQDLKAPGNALPPSEQTPQELYQAGKTADALERLTREPPRTATDHTNAALLALKTQQIGRAHAHLTMAATLAPGNSEIQALGESVQRQAKTLYGAQRLNAWATSPLSLFGTPGSALVSTTLGLLGLFLALSILRARNDPNPRVPRGYGWALLGVVLCVGIERGLSLWVLSNATPAVVYDATVGRNGPGSQFLERTRLEAGSRVLARPSSSRDGWILVETPQESLAWVEKSKVGLLFAEP